MRVLQLDSGRTMRGGQWQALSLLRGLRQRGVDVLLLGRGELAQAARVEGIPCEPLSWPALLRHRRWGSVVHAHDARTHTMAALAGLRPLVVSRRVVFPVKRGWLSHWKYRQAACYLAISKAALDQLVAAGVPAERIRVVPDGVPLGALPESRLHVVALESDDPGKCNGLIRQAAAQGGFPVQFRRDLKEAFRHARCFLYLSTAEGLGSAALLASGCGVPVVASDIPGLREAVLAGETGLLVDNNPSDVAAAVQQLLGDEVLALRMGEHGRQRVSREFNEDMMVERTLGIYKELQ